MNEHKPLNVALLAIPESSASTLYGMYDMFCSVGRDWPLVTEGQPGKSLISTSIVSRNGEGFASFNSAWIQPQKSFATMAQPDVICIPDLLVLPGESIRGRHEQELAWLRTQYAAGVYIATACTGALLLAEADMLNGQETTTHWAFCDAMREQYPQVKVQSERSLVIAGEEQRLLMAGGGTSWLDLALLLVARFFGAEEAMHLARMYLVDWHHQGQQPYAALTRPRHTDDALIAKCQQWVAHHYDEEAPVAKMAAMSGLNDRTFARRFSRATGMTPLEYIHALRLEEAKQLLEATEDPVEAIASEIGYEDTSFFSKLFRKKVGITPAQYRKRFGAIRKSLGDMTN